ncbi:MAG TPA: galactokinase [Solirubrobacteraceae bacterium]|nr:galactokinase [Solirubrobacteraceae bacterium]
MRMSVVAFAPGRVNLIGEHTDYNDGLALPFAIEQGVRVRATSRPGTQIVGARALDRRGETSRFEIGAPRADRHGDWRDFVRGTVAELAGAGFRLHGAELEITGDVPEGAGLSSSAALAVALCLALLAVSGIESPDDRTAMARLCSRVENEWVGAPTGLLDQLASLYGEPGHVLRIDFRSLEVRPVAMRLCGWTLATVPSGEEHSLADPESGYGERRRECERARTLLGLESLRDARPEQLDRLPAPLHRRVRHVLEENERVEQALSALERDDLQQIAALLDASHASLRDLYESSTDAVERTVEQLKRSGAAGARMIGGGFGGHVLALFAPGAPPPEGAHIVSPAAGARLLPGS